jgi:hypothetical protein
MKIRFIVAFTAIFLAIGIFLSSNFRTTESAGFLDSRCAIAPFKTAYQQSKAVFVGKVVSEEKNGDTKTFKFKVERYWKGKLAKNIEINVYETQRYQAWFQKDGKYLIYATAGEDGKLRVDRCSRSREIENGDEDLKQLGKGKIPR